MTIVQIRGKMPCAMSDLLKNENCTWSLKDYICRIFINKKTFLNVSLQYLHHNTAYDYRKESNNHFMLQQGVGHMHENVYKSKAS